MKLISCHVAHFGKISEFKYNFDDGFNAIIEENGWGKTTFSVFIKAMFYGLEYSPNTKKKLMERNHYLPWDGSVCGGNIVFSVKDRVYRIERTFGKTDKDDTFELYDNVTGLKSEDYSAEIGEELFRVDRESFEKSVYIPQLSMNTAMTDSLNAKMGNLASAKDDISNFDIALKAVKEARAEYTRNSKINPGKLHGVKLEINKCKEDLEKLPGIVEGYEAATCIMEEKQEQLDKLVEEKNALGLQIQEQSKREQELGAYKIYKNNILKEQDSLNQLAEFFKNGVPANDEIDILSQTDRDLSVHERTLEKLLDEQKHGTSVFEKPFEERIPDETEFAMWNKMATNLSELRAKAEHAKLSEEATKQLNDLRFFFGKKVPTNEELSYIEKLTTQVASLDGMIEQANERLITLKARLEAEKKLRSEKGIGVGTWIALAVAVILLATGIIFSNYTDNGLGILVERVAWIAAALDIVFVLIYHKGSNSGRNKVDEKFEDSLAQTEQELEKYKSQREGLEEECLEFLSFFLLTRAESMTENVYEIRRKLDQYNHLIEEEEAHRLNSADTLDELADLQLELYTKIQPFATAYGINLYDMGEEFDFLNQLKRDTDKYTHYLEELDEITRQQNIIKVMSAEINEALKRFPVDKNSIRAEQIAEISNNVAKYNGITARIAELFENIKAFEEKYDVNEEVLSVDELQAKQSQLDEEIVGLSKQITQDKENISHNAEELERLSDIQEHIERLENLESEYKDKAELLEMTSDYLQKAREGFLSKYMEPLQNGLHKYLSLIDSADKTKSGYSIDDFELDMDLNVRLDYSGSTKTAEYLSQGYQDLFALCSRLALVDVLYTDERPLLILDDPFTNFDEKKINEALKLLKEISKERQIIYFTCHESRK